MTSTPTLLTSSRSPLRAWPPSPSPVPPADLLLVCSTYAGGSHCGQKVRLTRTSTGKTITAMVADSCPTWCAASWRYDLQSNALTCASRRRSVNNSCLDLSVAAFTAIATEEEGMVRPALAISRAARD